jgi:hypothetical protein
MNHPQFITDDKNWCFSFLSSAPDTQVPRGVGLFLEWHLSLEHDIAIKQVFFGFFMKYIALLYSTKEMSHVYSMKK